jgi:NRPS condensation-like uncharacterized protein
MSTVRPDAATDTEWLRLDNAAKIYPASVKDATPPVFRLKATLDAPIHVHELQAAVDAVVERTPYYQVHLKPGFFWYYLERHRTRIVVEPMDATPIGTISLTKRNQNLIRVYARGRRIAVDFSHVLTDGYGGMVFLSSVIGDYLKRLGHQVKLGEPFLVPGETVSEDEYQDAYQAIYAKASPKAENQKPAYHIGGIPSGQYRLITGTMPIDQALRAARSYGATLTEYTVAAKLHAIAAIHQQQMDTLFKPRSSIVRVEVPVNMRKPFPSRTMRNFSLFVAPEVDLSVGSYDFPTIVRTVHHQMNLQLDRNQLLRQIARNVGGERNRFVRVIPRRIKYAYLSYLKRTIGNRTHSGVVSNLGRFLLPEDVRPFVKSIGFVLGPNSAYKVSCSMVSLGEQLSITIGSVLENRAMERGFFRQLASDKIDITVTEEP